MNYPSRVAWCLLGLFATACSFAQTVPLPANGPMNQGQVQAFIVAGNVSLVAKDGTVLPLKRGQTIEEGNVIKAAAGAQALLVFSNGIAVRVLENCQISIDEFKQASYDKQAEGTFLRLSKDPSKSIVSLDLRNGLAQFRVQTLNQAAGSTFVIKTPAGSFSTTGGIFSIFTDRNASGLVTKVLGNSYVGSLTISPSAPATNFVTITAAKPTIPAGGQIQLHFNFDPMTGAIRNLEVFGAGIPLGHSQKTIDALYETVDSANMIGGLSLPPPKALPPTPPKGWPLTDFDPDPVSPGLTK